MRPPLQYTATLRDVVPRGRAPIHSIPSAYVGLSIGNPNFTGERLRALLEWVSDHVDHCCLFLGSEVSRWTYRIERGISEGDAVVVAGRHARRQMRETRKVLATLSYQDRFTIMTDRDFRAHDRFESARAVLRQLQNNNARFASLVDASAREYCQRRLQAGRPMMVGQDHALEFSRQFILEELALFTVVVASGYPVEIYPGPELPVLQAMANGEFSDAPAELRSRTNLIIEVLPTVARRAA